jgi:hypothetical protein
MSDPINFDIEGLVARYELHPERRDVFVEGERDQGLLRAFLESHGQSSISVFSVAVVNISAHLLLQRGLPHPSRRSEVITLAMELEGRGVSPAQVACVADADFEHLLPQSLACALLLLTDYASMELYAFSGEVVQRVLVVLSPTTDSTGPGLIKDLGGPLQFLFSVRLVNFNLQLGLAWINGIEKFFGFQQGRIDFDEKEFMKRYLLDRLPMKQVEKFNARLSEIQSLLSSDVRCRIRGHDFVRILTWYLKTVEKCKYLNEDSVRQMMFVTIRSDDLARQPMFSSLLKRLAS